MAVKRFPENVAYPKPIHKQPFDAPAHAVSQKVLELYHRMPFQKPLELAFVKITGSLDDEERYMLENLDLAFSFRPFAPEDPDLRLLELVTRAVAERRGLRFAYRKPGKRKAGGRRMQPYHVFSYEGWMSLLAHDPARGATRTFVLGRMSEPTVEPSSIAVLKGPVSARRSVANPQTAD